MRSLPLFAAAAGLLLQPSRIGWTNKLNNTKHRPVVKRAENKCECDGNSTELYEYDTNLKRPICDGRKPPVPRSGKNDCQLRFVDIVSESSAVGRLRSIRVYRGALRDKCNCDPTRYEQFRDIYCIKNELLKDFKTYQIVNGRSSSFPDLKFIVFLCQVLHHRDYCNFLANLCVLSNFNLDKYGPCFPFYEQQTQENPNRYLTSSDFDATKMKPFLFFKSGRFARHLLEKTIDFSYGVNDVSIIIAVAARTQRLISMRFDAAFFPSLLFPHPDRTISNS